MPPAPLGHQSLRQLELDSDSDSDESNYGGLPGSNGAAFCTYPELALQEVQAAVKLAGCHQDLGSRALRGLLSRSHVAEATHMSLPKTASRPFRPPRRTPGVPEHCLPGLLWKAS